MPEITLRCPACKVLLKLKKLPTGKTAMPCPKCGTKVPLPREEEPEEEIPEVEAAGEGEREARPRRRKKKRSVNRAHLWPILGGACLGGVVLVFLFIFLVMGTKGFPDPEDSPVF